MRETLQTKLASQDAKSGNDEVDRLSVELQKLNMRYSEVVEVEEKKRQQIVEYWQVNLL